MFNAEKGKLVLLIDDDLDEQQLLVDAFAEVGPAYRVLCFDNAKSGLHFLRQLPKHDLPCLIVLDYDLPVMTGADILRRLQQMPQLHNIPVVIHSNSVAIGADDIKGASALVKKASNWQGMKENVRAFLFLRQELVVL